MAANHSFRSALNGFHREDVVHYIEYLNAKHTAQVNQLEAQVEELRKKLEEVPTAETPQQEPCPNCARLQEQLDALTAQTAETAEASQEPVSSEALVSRELEAYRRAERAERAAKERSDQIYRKAAGTLAQATAQVDEAAERVQQLVDRVSGHITDLQAAVELSKSALLDAATTMYGIRPEDQEA